SHRCLILFGSLLVALLPIVLAWGYGEMWEGGEPLPNPRVYRALLPLSWLIAGIAVCGNTWVEAHLFWPGSAPLDPPTSKGKIPKPVWRSFVLYIIWSLLLYLSVDFFLDGALNDTNRIPTY